MSTGKQYLVEIPDRSKLNIIILVLLLFMILFFFFLIEKTIFPLIIMTLFMVAFATIFRKVIKGDIYFVLLSKDILTYGKKGEESLEQISLKDLSKLICYRGGSLDYMSFQSDTEILRLGYPYILKMDEIGRALVDLNPNIKIVEEY